MLAVLVAQIIATREGVQADVVMLGVIIGTILPLLTATLTNITASSKTKVIVNTALSIVGGTLAYLVANDGKATWVQLGLAVAAAFAASGVSHNHLWKQLNVTAWIAVATKYFGVGRNQRLQMTISTNGLDNADLVQALNHPLGFKRAVGAIATERSAHHGSIHS